MAKYYYCNGTTKKGLPCQNPVPKEGEKCAYHNGGRGGSGKPVFSLLKSAVDVMLYLHAVNQATPFIIEVTKKILEIAAYNLDMPTRNLQNMNTLLEQNEVVITKKIISLDETDLDKIIEVSNLAVAISDAQKHLVGEKVLEPA